MNEDVKTPAPAPGGTGIAARTQACRETYAATRDHRKAVAAYCAGNRWLEENARAAGNWPKDG